MPLSAATPPGRDDVARLLATADVAMAPGPVETFGLAALEALACGTPVVVDAASALPEVVGAAGEAVSGDFAAGVGRVLGRDAVGRRVAARARAERFHWRYAVDGFLAAHGAAAHRAAEHPAAHPASTVVARCSPTRHGVVGIASDASR